MVKVTAAKTKNTKAAVSRTVTVTVKVEAGTKAAKAQSASPQAARPLTAAAF